ncbi:MAG: RNA polymerase sigma factor [Pyrinomonadaceae bacterium]
MQKAAKTAKEDEDKQLVEKCKERDENAFEELLIKYERRVYSKCFEMTNSQAESEELRQDISSRT